MPVILHPRDYERWLRPADPECLPIDLFRPHASEDVTCWRVGRTVGNVKNDAPELLLPDQDPPPDSLRLF